MARLLIAIALALLLSGCLSTGQGTSVDAETDDDQEPRSSSGFHRTGADPTGMDSVPADAAPVPAASSDPAPNAAPAPRPWWNLSVAEAPEGGVASFRWQIPLDDPAVDLSNPWTWQLFLDVVPQALGNVTSWTLGFAQARDGAMQLGATYADVPHVVSTRPLQSWTDPQSRSADFLPFAADLTGLREDGTVWIILTATGEGRLNVALRLNHTHDYLLYQRPGQDLLDEFATGGPRSDLVPFARTLGASYDWFRQWGSVPIGRGSTSFTSGVQISGPTDLATPVAEAGAIRLKWSAPWAKWSSVSWDTQDFLGGKAIDYQVTVGPSSLVGATIVPGTLIVQTGNTAYGWLERDGDGAQAELGFTMGSTGDWMGVSFIALALGASLEDLTGVPSLQTTHQPAVVGLS